MDGQTRPWVWISGLAPQPVGDHRTLQNLSLASLSSVPVRQCPLGGAAASESSMENRGKDPPPHCPMAQGLFGRPVCLSSARKMLQIPSLKEAELPESTQATVNGVNWPLFSSRAALICLVNPGDHMLLFNEDPNLPNSQFKQSHLWKSLTQHWSIST